jgi:site-specific DNA recombinase
LTGLQQQLKAQKLLREFVRTHQEERKRLATDKVRQRAKLESKLAEIQRSLNRM